MKKLIDKSEYFNIIVDTCSQNAPIHRVYEIMSGQSTRYGGGKQENVSCPWHGYRGDLRPSATIYPDTNMFYCHVCTEKPLNVVDFVKEKRGWRFSEAIEWLEATFNFKAIDESLYSFSDGLEQQIELRESNFSEEKFREQLVYFESNLIKQKAYFNFEIYCKLFYVYDIVRRQFHRSEISPAEAYLRLNRLKDKVYQILERAFQEVDEDGQEKNEKEDD